MNSNELLERLRKLRIVVEAQAEMCLSQIDGLMGELEPDETEDGEARCPGCKSTNHESSSVMGEDSRETCMECGESWTPAMEVMNG